MPKDFDPKRLFREILQLLYCTVIQLKGLLKEETLAAMNLINSSDNDVFKEKTDAMKIAG